MALLLTILLLVQVWTEVNYQLAMLLGQFLPFSSNKYF